MPTMMLGEPVKVIRPGLSEIRLSRRFSVAPIASL
jgi:hypothetical protein